MRCDSNPPQLDHILVQAGCVIATAGIVNATRRMMDPISRKFLRIREP
jgi:hypothetical protein